MIARRALIGMKNEVLLTLASADGWMDSLTGSAGENVTADSALGLSPVHAAVRTLGDSMGKLPIYIMRTNGQDREIDPKHPLNYLLNVRPNEAMTPMMMKKAVMSNQVLHGNGYVYVNFDAKGRPVELLPLPAENTTVMIDDFGKLWYTFFLRNSLTRKVQADSIIHMPWVSLDGYVGRGLLHYAKETISTDAAAQKYSGKFYRNGARPSGIIEVPTEVDKDSKEIVRGEFDKMVSGVDNAFRVAVLDMGMKYTQMGLPQKDAQFIESRGFSVEEVARFTGVPGYKLQTGKQSYQSNEQQGLDYITNTLQPIVTQWEQEFTYKLFLLSELKRGYYLRFNMAAEMRGDNESRAKYYETMIRNGIYSINECRAFEDMNALAQGGNLHFITRNYMTLEQAVQPGNTGTGTVPQTPDAGGGEVI